MCIRDRVIGVDNTPPAIAATISPPSNAAGWNNSNVTVGFTCSDQTSGIASCPSPVVLAMEGANQVVSGTATDNAGNKATASVTVNLDKTCLLYTSTECSSIRKTTLLSRSPAFVTAAKPTADLCQRQTRMRFRLLPEVVLDCGSS